MGHGKNPDLRCELDEDEGIREAREQGSSDHEVGGQIEETREGRGRGLDEWQDSAHLGEKLCIQPWPLGPVPLGCLGQFTNRLSCEADNTQRLESRL
jgi:hypothetical protein